MVLMDEHVKTVGYLLKHYTDNQCYDQYVELRWLKERIHKEINLVNLKRGHQFDDNHAYQAGMFQILTLLEG